jgi:hypothetical protein
MNFIEMVKRNVGWTTKALVLVFALAYGLGFVIWNLYLSAYGFFEYKLLQTRFLSSGLLALGFLPALIILPYLGYKGLISLVKRLSELEREIISLLMGGVLFLFTLYAYTFFVFPYIPQYLGGAHPYVKSIIAEPDEMDFLSDLNFALPDNGGKRPIQTDFICEIYSNEDVIIVGVGEDDKHKRVITFNKNLFKGYQTVPHAYLDEARKSKCNSFIYKLF